MRPVVSLFVVLLAALTACAALASEPSVRRLLGKYNTIRPDDDQLAMYRLDWVESLADAQDLALLENRPVCLMVIHARYGNITSGHC
jgi:hypothetical protein